MKRIAGYIAVTIILVFASLWVLAQVDLADLNQFLAGTKIEAELMNENFDLVRDAIEELQDQAGVTSLNGQDGPLVLEAGDNVVIDDSEEGTIVISSTAAGSGGGDITAVTAGEGLNGGGDSGAVTLSVAFAGNGSTSNAARSDHEHDARYYTQSQVDALLASLLPTGTVMSFFLAECPSGWSEFEQAQGRMIVGLQEGGTLGGSVGDSLSNQENRSHSHSYDPPSSTTSTGGGHDHIWSSMDDGVWTAGDGQQMMAWTNGLDGDGTGIYPIAVQSKDVRDFETNRTGEHSHSFNLGSSNTDTERIDLPYIQLLMCVRD